MQITTISGLRCAVLAFMRNKQVSVYFAALSPPPLRCCSHATRSVRIYRKMTPHRRLTLSPVPNLSACSGAMMPCSFNEWLAAATTILNCAMQADLLQAPAEQPGHKGLAPLLNIQSMAHSQSYASANCSLSPTQGV